MEKIVNQNRTVNPSLVCNILVYYTQITNNITDYTYFQVP